MSGKISVVIPYYQEEPGILRGAVMSAIAQEGVSDLEIIVVDDGSPAPARADLMGLDLPRYATLRLIEQANRGPGAARNRALEEVTSSTLVAFLDSDDRWKKDHLHRAKYALGKGFDIYFSNAAGYGAGLFEGRLDESRHRCIDVKRHLYTFVGDAGPSIIGHLSPIHTSTLVYRHDRFENLRFPESFMMGEDVTFWLLLVKQSDKIAFSSEIECMFDHGIHIARHSNWGTRRFIWRTCHAMSWRKWMQRNLILTEQETRENRLQIDRLRVEFIMGLLHDARRLRIDEPSVVRFLFEDPAVLLYLFPVTVQVAMRRMRLLR